MSVEPNILAMQFHRRSFDPGSAKEQQHSTPIHPVHSTKGGQMTKLQTARNWQGQCFALVWKLLRKP